MKPALTICIPTFNRAEYLNRCLAGLLAWVPEEWHILVGNNASTDYTYETLLSYPRVDTIHRPANLGAEANLFDLYTKAAGTYVTYLADDDELDPEAFMVAFDVLQRSSAVALYATWSCIDKVAMTSKPFYTLPELPPTPLGVFKMLCQQSAIPEIGIFKREAAVRAFQLSPFAYWAFMAYGNLRREGTVLLSSTPFYRNILKHFEGEGRQTLGTTQCITHLGEFRGGLEYLLGVCLEEEGKQNDIAAIREGQFWISAFMSGRLEVASRLSGDPVLEKRFVSFGGRG